MQVQGGKFLINICREKGETPALKLEKFNSGNREVTIEAKDVGLVQRVRIRFVVFVLHCSSSGGR